MAKKNKVLLTGLILGVVICIVGELGVGGITMLREAYAQHRKIEQFHKDLVDASWEDPVDMEDISIEECVRALNDDQYDESVKVYLINRMYDTYTEKEVTDTMTGLLTDDTTDLALKWLIVENPYGGEEYLEYPEQFYTSVGQMLLSADNYRHAYACANYWGASQCMWEYLEAVLESPDDYPEYIVLGAAVAVYETYGVGTDMGKIALEIMGKTLVSCPMTPENQQMLVACYKAADTPEEMKLMLDHLDVIWQSKAQYDRELLEDHLYHIAYRSDILIKWLLDDPTTEVINRIITYCNVWIEYNGYTYGYLNEQLLTVLNKAINQGTKEQLKKLEIYEIRYIDDKTILTMDLDGDGEKDTVTIYSHTTRREMVLEIAFGNGDSLTYPALDTSGTSWTGDFKLYMQDVNADAVEELVLLGLYTISDSAESEDAAYDPEARMEIGVSVFSKDEGSDEYQMLTVDDRWELYFPAEDADFVDEQDIPYNMLWEKEQRSLW